MKKDEKIIEILNSKPSQKIGLDDFYGKQTVINMLNEAINYTRCCTELPTKYSIAFAGFVATNVEVQGSKIKVLDSMNGWGDKIPSKSISIIKK